MTEDRVRVYFGNDGPGPPLEDVDGNIYNTVWIGSQLWMAENLRVTEFNNNGDRIVQVNSAIDWADLGEPAYCMYNFDYAEFVIYGALYNYAIVTNQNNICPDGWHVPDEIDIHELSDYLSYENVGGKLKEAGFGHWDPPNEGATNESGFTALPGGLVSVSGDFALLNQRRSEGDAYSNERGLFHTLCAGLKVI